MYLLSLTKPKLPATGLVFLSALLGLVALNPAHAQGMGGMGYMRCPMGMMCGPLGMVLGGALVIAGVAALIALAVFLVRRGRSGGRPGI